MESKRVIVGKAMIDLSAVSSAHWEDDKLYLYFMGGRFLRFDQGQATCVWNALIEGVGVLMVGPSEENSALKV